LWPFSPSNPGEVFLTVLHIHVSSVPKGSLFFEDSDVSGLYDI
jgi:hypothetical protein